MYNSIAERSDTMSTNSKALGSFLEKNQLLREKVRGLPNLGTRLDGGLFSTEVSCC